jgi:hypothetical protein
MLSVSADPSLKWAETCDQVRSHIVGLPVNAGCFVFPSIEAALTEVAILLADREREIGGERNLIVYGLRQDPAIDRMAKTISSTGLEAKPKTDSEWAEIETWLPEVKSKAILIAHAEDDRFTGRVHDVTLRRAAFFKDGFRIPILSLCFSPGLEMNAWRLALPRPFEIRVYPLSGVDASGSPAALAVVGERLRLEPRMAPISMDPLRLAQIEELLSEGPVTKTVAPDLYAAELQKARSEIETFEASLPPPFQAWWPKDASRMVDRAVITSKDFDGSFVVEALRASFKKSAKMSTPEMIDRGLFALSGCSMNDERRQEWLRARGDDAWLIRGAVSVSRELLHTATPDAINSALKDVAKSK